MNARSGSVLAYRDQVYVRTVHPHELVSVHFTARCDDFGVARVFQPVRAETNFLTIFTGWKARATLVAATTVQNIRVIEQAASKLGPYNWNQSDLST